MKNPLNLCFELLIAAAKFRTARNFPHKICSSTEKIDAISERSTLTTRRSCQAWASAWMAEIGCLCKRIATMIGLKSSLSANLWRSIR
jgi:hypothetical protein